MPVLVEEKPTTTNPLDDEDEDFSTMGPSLSDELQSLTEKFLNAAPEQVQEIFLNHIKEWKGTDLLHDALKEGDVAPDFVLPDQDGNLISSVDLRAKGPIVVVFFRGNWCSFCNTTLRTIRKYTPHFKARGATVVAISPQTIEQSKEMQENAGLTFPVLSDPGSEYSQLLNIAYVLDENVKAIIEGAAGKTMSEINGSNGYNEAVLPIPATYVIETNGRVTYSYLDTDFTKRAEPVDVLNALPRLPKNRRLSLSQRIDVEMGKLRDTHPEHRMKLLFDAVEELKAQGVERRALQVGQKAPDFSFVGRDGERIDSKRLRRNGPLVVTFHYGHQSPLCMLQLEAMQRYLSQFEAKGASVVAIEASRHTAGRKEPRSVPTTYYYSGFKFPMMQDYMPYQNQSKPSVAQQFGLLHQLPTGNLFGVDDNGIMLELPLAATYLIDRSGTILYAFVNADPTQRPEPSDVLKAIPTKFQRQAPIKRGPFSMLFGGRLVARANKRARRNSSSVE